MKNFKVYHKNSIGNEFRDPVIIRAETSADAVVLFKDRYPDIIISRIEEQRKPLIQRLIPFQEKEEDNPPLFI